MNISVIKKKIHIKKNVNEKHEKPNAERTNDR